MSDEDNDGVDNDAPFLKRYKVVVPRWERVLLQDGLYVQHEVDEPGYVTLNGFRYGRLSLDVYCIWCKAKTVFRNIGFQDAMNRSIMLSRHGERGYSPDTVTPDPDGDFELILECTRVPKHRISFYFVVVGRSLTKVGQYPSHADLAVADLEVFDGVLDHRWMRELKRGVGLHAHGASIGGFVYLRRVFEHLIERSQVRAATKPGWNEESYVKSRLSERIHLLAAELPTLLVENAAIYRILSSGIHELSEEECSEYFPVMREGIELILGRMAEDKNRGEREAALSSAIGRITSKFGKGGSKDDAT